MHPPLLSCPTDDGVQSQQNETYCLPSRKGNMNITICNMAFGRSMHTTSEGVTACGMTAGCFLWMTALLFSMGDESHGCSQ